MNLNNDAVLGGNIRNYETGSETNKITNCNKEGFMLKKIMVSHNPNGKDLLKKTFKYGTKTWDL